MNNKVWNIMVVDDDELVLNALKRSLRNEGFSLLTASSGEEALQLLSEHEVAVIISDYRMPEMTGTDFLEKAKSISPRTSRIILTGYADLEMAQEAINRSEVHKLMFKPWDDLDLKATVSHAVRSYRFSKGSQHVITKLTNLISLKDQENQELRKHHFYF